MKLLIASLVFLLTSISSPQADLTIDLLLHDSGTPPYGGSAVISFGLDSTATDGIDPQLGEIQFPTDICPGWLPFFCAKFILPPFDGSLDSPKDFRFGELPFTGQITHMILFVSADSVVTMVYNLPPGVSINLIDQLGGIFINVNLADSGQVLIPNNGITTMGLWMYVDYNNVIPVEFTTLAASVLQNDKTVQLNWSTATETNNSGFEIQRSEVGGQRSESSRWMEIGCVPGFGTTTEPKSYSFIDENVTKGIYKYRLKQIDYDGTFTYSNEIKVEVDFTPKEFVLYQNYPNPFNPATQIKYSIQSVILRQAKSGIMVTLKVYDVLGNEVATLINEEKQPGVYEVEFNASLLASGMYLCKLQAGNFVQTMKMVLMK